MPFACAHEHILQNLFSLGAQPPWPFGHLPATRLGHSSQAMPQTPILIGQGMRNGTQIPFVQSHERIIYYPSTPSIGR
jgi:hypothetical protein